MYGRCNSFDGEVVSPDLYDNPEKLKSFDLMAMIGRNSKEICRPEIFACAKALKQEHGFKKLGAIGFCYDAWAILRLAAKGILQPRHSQHVMLSDQTRLTLMY
jgi:dienelactone hydrolase